MLLTPETILHRLTPRNLLLAFLEIQCIRIHAFSLGHQKEGGNGTCNVASEEDPEDVCYAEFAWRAQIVEQYAGQNGTKFSSGGTDSVGEAAYPGGIELSRNNEGSGVGTEVEEHLKTRNQQRALASCGKSLWLTWAIVKQTNFPAVPRCA